MGVNYTNLRLAADYIEKHVNDEHFNMSCFRQSDDGEEVPFETREDCGTIGCSLGHCPFVPGLEPVKDEFTGRRIWPSKYSSANSRQAQILSFNTYSDNKFGLTDGDTLFQFMFSGQWELYEPSRAEAVKRIRRVARQEITSENVENYMPFET